MKNTFLTILVTLFALTVPAIAQDSPKVEGFGGYSFLRSNGDTANGLNAGGAFNFLRSSSGDLDVGGALFSGVGHYSISLITFSAASATWAGVARNAARKPSGPAK